MAAGQVQAAGGAQAGAAAKAQAPAARRQAQGRRTAQAQATSNATAAGKRGGPRRTDAGSVNGGDDDTRRVAVMTRPGADSN